jgi:hypothetical protein
MKLPMYLFFNLALGLNDFDGGQWKKLALKIKNFLDLKGQQVNWVPVAQNNLMALEMDLPASKSLHPTPYKQQVH